jgi:uncharacterized protein (TIGR03437 family)
LDDTLGANAVIGLTSNNTNVVVPSSITITAGQTTVQFTATVSAVTSGQTAIITASFDGGSATETLSLNPPPPLSSLSCTPGTLNGGQSATCTAALGEAGDSNLTVSLSDNSTQLTTPGSVTITSGQVSNTFTVTAAATITSSQSVTITGTLNGVSRTAQVNLTAPGQLSSLSCTPNTFNGAGSAACTATLSSAAGANTVIGLVSNNAAVTVPASVTVVAGNTAAQFTATVAAVTSEQAVTITASLGAGSQSATITLNVSGQNLLSSLLCIPATLGGGQSSTCTASLSQNATASVTVSLSDNSPQLATPGSVTIAAGQSSNTFLVTAAATITSPGSVTVTASLNGVSKTAQVTLATQGQLNGLGCGPNTFNSAGTADCTLTLQGPAPVNTVISLSSNNTNVTVPASVSIAAGQSSAVFQAAVAAVSASQTATLSAALNGDSVTATITLNAAAQPGQLSSLSCSPEVLGSGQSSTCTAVLNGNAAADVAVQLNTNNPVVTVPPSVTIAMGQGSATFTVTAGTVAGSQVAGLTATANGVTVTAQLSLLGPGQLSSLTCTPGNFNAAGQAACAVALSSPAGSTTVLSLASNNANVTVPPSLTISQGQTGGQFTANVAAVSSDQVAIVSATVGSETIQFSISLNRPSLLMSMSCAPASLASMQSSTCTVTRTAISETNLALGLTDNSDHLSVPSSVVIFAGQTNASFTATAGDVVMNEIATIMASVGGETVSAAITLQSGVDPVIEAPESVSTRAENLVSFDVSVTQPNGLPVGLVAESLPPNGIFVNGHFSWVPADGDVGEHQVVIRATDAGGGTATTTVRIRVVAAQPALLGLYNPAGFIPSQSCSVNALATILGSGFTVREPQQATTMPWPTEIAGVRVWGDGQLLPLLYVSDTMIHFQCLNWKPGQTVALTVEIIEESTAGSALPATLGPINVTVAAATPSIYTLGGAQGAILIAGTNLVAAPAGDPAGRPASIGEYLEIFTNGLGPMSELLPAGTAAPADRLILARATIRVVLGAAQRRVTPSFAGLIPGSVAFFQVNAPLEAGVETGPTVPVHLELTLEDGTVIVSNTVTVAISQ